MANALITGLSDEEIKQMHEWKIEKSREIGYAEGRAKCRVNGHEEGRTEVRYEDVDRLAAEGILSLEKACEILGVPEEKYREWKAGSHTPEI